MGLFSTFTPKKPASSGARRDAADEGESDSMYTDRPEPIGSEGSLKDHGSVTPREFRQRFMAHLRDKGLSARQRERIEELATGFLDRDRGRVGMDHRELNEFMDAIHENKHDFNLSDGDIRDIEEGLSKQQ